MVDWKDLLGSLAREVMASGNAPNQLPPAALQSLLAAANARGSAFNPIANQMNLTQQLPGQMGLSQPEGQPGLNYGVLTQLLANNPGLGQLAQHREQPPAEPQKSGGERRRSFRGGEGGSRRSPPPSAGTGSGQNYASRHQQVGLWESAAGMAFSWCAAADMVCIERNGDAGGARCDGRARRG